MKKYDITSSIIILILGILLLLVPGSIVTTIIRLFGVIILLVGISSVQSELKIKKQSTDFVNGILISILGLVFISSPHTIASIIPFILGTWITIKSIFKLQVSYSLKGTSIDYVKPLIINIISLILGLVLMFNPFKGAEALIRIIGGFMMTYGLLDILNYECTRSKKVKVLK